ncbi:hypothetical protein N658DRAFT_420672 [Parathielavia hyrcaniae]|uniref:DNA polymerase delta subunit 3 n=1 Tax=Parathielavia hyrcaniae TaxID=113614 RepID=A0AAN6T490_9PEZI|nr:hypothetical protein N658DRAFT_420672 [Parathielavia hyrcaniae]
MDTYKRFLAENVLTEDKVVTYRFLSRALQVHVNTAKQMLYEFHRSQNAKRPGAVHATYLVYGTKRAGTRSTDGDIDMSSSAPEVESLTEDVPTSTLSLVPEERLKEILTDYAEVTSIHVYSIGPHPAKDMALLADAAHHVLTLDTVADQKGLAPIINPNVRRRERQGAGLKAAAATTQVKSASKPAQAPASAKVKEESKPAQPVQETVDKGSSGPTKKAAPPLKRGASSGIMQAFSKAASKPAKVKKEAEAPQPAQASGKDSTMQPLSDDGEDDEELPQAKPRSSSGFRSRKEREEALRRMMDEDDDIDEDETPEKEDTPEEEPMEEEPAAPEPVKEEETEVVTASTNGRRRGKRRVMRKKQIMDDQGYLVTIQEPGWESFSEDEAPPPAKSKAMSSAAPAQAAKLKKGGAKGQGSIMSFFSKK